MCQRTAVAQRLSGNDVDGTRNGRRPKESRTAAPHHLYPLNHVGRNLFQAIHPRQGTEDGTRVHEYLCVGTVEPVDAHLLEAAVLAIVLDPHTRLKVEPLGQRAGVGILEGLYVQHIDQRRGQLPRSLAAVGRNHHAVECHVTRLDFEIDLQRHTLFQRHLPPARLITYRRGLEHEIALGQILQKVVTRTVGHRPHGGPLQRNRDVGQVFPHMLVEHMAHNVYIQCFLSCRFGTTHADMPQAYHA